MSKKVAFRSSLGGYNRKDVNDYLIARSRETQKLIEQKNAAIADLNDRVARLAGEVQSAADSLKDEVRSDAGELAVSLEALRSLVGSLLGELESSETELARMSVYRAKAEKFDRFASSLSDIFSLDPGVSPAAEPDAGVSRTAEFRERADARFGEFSALLERLAARTGEK